MLEAPSVATPFLFPAVLLEDEEKRVSKHKKAAALTDCESCTLFSVPSLGANPRFTDPAGLGTGTREPLALCWTGERRKRRSWHPCGNREMAAQREVFSEGVI